MYICSQLLFLFLCKLYFTQHNTPHIDPRSQKNARASPFWWLHILPLCIWYRAYYLVTLWWTFKFWLFCLCELFQWTWEYRCPFHILVSAPLSIFPKVSFLHHIVVLFLVGIFFFLRDLRIIYIVTLLIYFLTNDHSFICIVSYSLSSFDKRLF